MALFSKSLSTKLYSRIIASAMVRAFLYLCFVIAADFLCPTDVKAQERGDSVVSPAIVQHVEQARQRLDSVLNNRDKRSVKSVDTLYLQRAAERLRLKATLNASGSEIVARGESDGTRYKSVLEANNKYTFSLAASYRGLTLSVAVNPAKWAGKNKDIEFNLNAYGNRMGADVIFQSARTFKGTTTIDGIDYTMPTGMVRQDMLRVNAYYAFNARRFSYPAAFSQSWIQRKSCGSFMAGLSFSGSRIKISHDETLGNATSTLRMAYIGIGAGYGYNFVMKHRWLLHLSTVPQLVVFNRSKLTIGEEKEKSPYRFPNIVTVGRIAVVRHFTRYFAGMTAVVNTATVGDRDQLHLTTIKWRARIFFGIKL